MITLALMLALQTTPVVGSGNGSGNVVSSDVLADTNKLILVSPPFFTGRIPAGCEILVEKGWVVGAVCPRDVSKLKGIEEAPTKKPEKREKIKK